MIQNQSNQKGNQPSHILYHVREDDSDKGYWQKIGAGWQHDDGEGVSLQLDYIPVNSGGRLVLRTNKPKPEQQPDMQHAT